MNTVYHVQYLIRKSIRVEAEDDIQAEIEAFNQLDPEDRNCIEKQRVCDSYSIPIRDGNQPCQIDGTYETPDIDWLKENLRETDALEDPA